MKNYEISNFTSFWKFYESLNEDIKQKARKTYNLWKKNPFHPSLRFKC